MDVQLCINNRIIADGISRVIQATLPEAVVGDHFFESSLNEPDIVIFSSREQMSSLKEIYTNTKFICCDLGLSDSDIACLLYCHGVQGIISCNLGVDRLAKALKTVHQGDIWLEQSHLHILLQQGKLLPDLKKLRPLSDQDRTIIQSVARGESNKDIADKLCLSLPTVKAHMGRIFKQLNVHNRSQLAALATKDISEPIG